MCIPCNIRLIRNKPFKFHPDIMESRVFLVDDVCCSHSHYRLLFFSLAFIYPYSLFNGSPEVP